MRFDEGQHRAARDLRQAVATAPADTVRPIGQQDLVLPDGDFPRGPVDLIADAIGDVITLIASLAHGTHFIGIQPLVVGVDDGVGFHLPPHLFGRVDSAGDDRIPVVRALESELRQGQRRLRRRFLGGTGRPRLDLDLLTRLARRKAHERENRNDYEKKFHNA